MASRIARIKYEQEQARIKKANEEKKQNDAKQEAQKELERIEAGKQAVANEAKIARAGLLLRQALAMNSLQSYLILLLHWRSTQVREKQRETYVREEELRVEELARHAKKEQELREAEERERAELLERQQELATAAAKKSAEMDETRVPNERDSGNRMWALEHILDPEIRSQVRPMHMQKLGSTLGNLQNAGYGKQEINAVCRALYTTQSEASMKPAWFVFDVGGRGEVDIEMFRKALPLMGESVGPEKIEKLFAEADQDGSGTIDFPEFVTFMRALNPMPGDLKKKTFSSTAATVVTVLDEDLHRRLHPLQKRKAGVIITQMLEAGFVESQCNAVCRALFLGQSLRDAAWQAAWEVFDTDGSGELDALEFKSALRLMGENVSEERLDVLFEQADQDGSGLIEFEEFVGLLRAMNPKPSMGSTVQKKRKKAAKDEPKVAELELSTPLGAWLEEVGAVEYEQEFAASGLAEPKKIMELTLVQLGEALRISNAERNVLFNLIYAFRRKMEKADAMRELEVKNQLATSRAKAAKQKANRLRLQSTQIRQAEMDMMKRLAVDRIAVSTAHAKERIRVRREVEEKFDLLGTTQLIARSASPLKSPSAIRHTLTAPPRSPGPRKSTWLTNSVSPLPSPTRPGCSEGLLLPPI